ncbi:MAG: response regulator [Methanoregula sp.]|jgi:PAS domain S-box-containing protein
MISILYVDDEPALLEIGKAFLEQDVLFSVDIIPSAPAALALLTTKKYDAIISDYQMPDMDGIEFLKQVRAVGNTLPFILFTGRGREEIVIQALNEGADFYLQKGGDPLSQFTELAHKTRHAVKKRWDEASIRDHERREADIINFLPDATFAIDKSGTVIFWNQAMEEMTRVLASEIIGKDNSEYAIALYHERRPLLIDLIMAPNEPCEKDRYIYTARDNRMLTAETTFQGPDGTPVHLWGKASRLFDENGNLAGAIESIRDITERRKAEEALADNRRMLDTLMHNLPGMVYRCRNDPDWTLEFVSGGCRDLTGYDPVDLINNHLVSFGSLIVPEERQYIYDEIQKSVESLHPFQLEYRITDKTGRIRWVWEQGRGVFNTENELVALEGYITDSSENKQASDALRQANRNLNILYGITRHDINNQILALNSFIDLLHEKTPDPALDYYFTWILQSIARISTMIRFTKEYESIGITAPAWQDPRTVVDTAIQQAPLGKIPVKNDLPAGTEIFADPMIVKVFYNLMDNAVRYGGKITAIRFFLEPRDGDHILVCEDDGFGIPCGDKEKIFNRGFGKNTGLGLFLAREILSITGLTITETGETGLGARFEITIPPGVFRLCEVQ